MVADAEVLREPQSLKEEFSASQREHPSSPADPVSVGAGTAAQTSQPGDTADEQRAAWDGWQVYRSDHGIL